jgi:spore maturation protein CgeB
MEAEGLIAGTHYASYDRDPREAIDYWLARPEERERITRAGQELVLNRFTYDRQVEELCRVIEETL